MVDTRYGLPWLGFPSGIFIARRPRDKNASYAAGSDVFNGLLNSLHDECTMHQKHRSRHKSFAFRTEIALPLFEDLKRILGVDASG